MAARPLAIAMREWQRRSELPARVSLSMHLGSLRHGPVPAAPPDVLIARARGERSFQRSFCL
jgi:hypothetical protein